jgi:hypothetical protein
MISFCSPEWKRDSRGIVRTSGNARAENSNRLLIISPGHLAGCPWAWCLGTIPPEPLPLACRNRRAAAARKGGHPFGELERAVVVTNCCRRRCTMIGAISIWRHGHRSAVAAAVTRKGRDPRRYFRRTRQYKPPAGLGRAALLGCAIGRGPSPSGEGATQDSQQQFNGLIGLSPIPILLRECNIIEATITLESRSVKNCFD